MFEAEIKYVATGPVAPAGECLGETTYADVYYDRPDGSLAASGRELRLRRTDGRAVLTFKAAPFDAASRSKEEWETDVTDDEVMEAILRGLGFVRRVAFVKRCRRYRDVHHGLPLAITVVDTDFAPRPFVEIEHLAADRTAGLAALPVIRDYAARLGLATECPDYYTDLCLAAGADGTSEGA